METKVVINQKLEYWRKKLIDLSKRNNLISYRVTKSKSLVVISPDIKQIIEDLNNEKHIEFIKKNEEENVSGEARKWVTSETDETTEKKLNNLYLKAKNNFQELGLSTCFVSIGSVTYFDADHSDLDRNAPIFIFPVEIERKNVSQRTQKYHINSNNSDIELNPALVEKLEHEYKITLREQIDEETIEEYFLYLKGVLAPLQRWSIKEDIHVDIFMYQKFVMYKDLGEHKNLVEESPLVQAYVGDFNALQDDIAFEQGDDFDDTTGIDVLKADSSQKRAIELAKAGVTFVLQGPPGTGKSQTIVNIISALMEQKKKILFVSQKMAALNVVQQRLDEIGMGRYCLNLHKFCGDKKSVVKQFMDEYLTKPQIPAEAQSTPYEQYLAINRELNQYYEYLCKTRIQFGRSLYELRGGLARYQEAPIIEMPLTETLKVDRDELNRRLAQLERLELQLQIVSSPTKHPLFVFRAQMNTLANNRAFIGQINRIVPEFIKIQEEASSF
ncbi:MAG: DUF4011 domain-containing protein, partial [Acidobacteriota bacterium]